MHNWFPYKSRASDRSNVLCAFVIADDISALNLSGIAERIVGTCIFRAAATRRAKSRHDEDRRRGEEWTTLYYVVISHRRVAFLVLTRKEQSETFVFLLLRTGVTIIIVA